MQNVMLDGDIDRRKRYHHCDLRCKSSLAELAIPALENQCQQGLSARAIHIVKIPGGPVAELYTNLGAFETRLAAFATSQTNSDTALQT